MRERVRGVEFEVQLEDIDARFAKEAEVAPLGMFCDHRSQVLFRNSPNARDPRNLKFRSGWRNMRVKTRAGTRDQINRHRHIGIFGLQLCDVGIYAIGEGFVRWPEIRASARGRVIAVSCGRWARMKILWRAEGLADDSRSDQFAAWRK